MREAMGKYLKSALAKIETASQRLFHSSIFKGQKYFVLLGISVGLWLIPGQLEVPLKWTFSKTELVSQLAGGSSTSLNSREVPKDFEMTFSFTSPALTPESLLTLTGIPGNFSVVINQEKELRAISSASPPFQVSVLLLKQIEPQKEYKISISLKEHRHLEAHKILPDGSREPLAKYSDHSFNFGSERVLVGQEVPKPEFSNINLEKLEVQFYKYNKHVWRGTQILRYLNFLFLVILIFGKICKVRINASFQIPAKKISFVTAFIVIGFSAAVFYHFIRGYLFSEPYPHDSYFFFKGAHFSDYFGVRFLHKNLNPYGTVASYPPLMYILSWPATLIDNGVLEILVFSTFFYLSVFLLAYKMLKNHTDPLIAGLASFSITFLAYPSQFLVMRGNLDLLVFPFVFWGLYYFKKERTNLAAFNLGMATALKVTPAAFFLLFFRDKKYRLMFKTALFFITLNLICAMFFVDGLGSLKKMYYNMTTAYVPWTLTDFSIYFGHSLRGLLRILHYNFIDRNYQEGPQSWHLLYKAMAVLAVFATLATVYFQRQMAFWKQITLLSLLSLLFPFFSPDYKLVLLLICMVFFLISTEEEPFAFAYTVFFSFLLVPKDFYRFDFVSWQPVLINVSASAAISPIFLLAIWCLIMLSENHNYFKGLANKK